MLWLKTVMLNKFNLKIIILLAALAASVAGLLIGKQLQSPAEKKSFAISNFHGTYLHSPRQISAFELQGIQKASSWEMSQSSVGDDSGFVFTITTAGQIQYTNNNYSGFVSAPVRFRALVTTV